MKWLHTRSFNKPFTAGNVGLVLSPAEWGTVAGGRASGHSVRQSARDWAQRRHGSHSAARQLQTAQQRQQLQTVQHSYRQHNNYKQYNTATDNTTTGSTTATTQQLHTVQHNYRQHNIYRQYTSYNTTTDNTTTTAQHGSYWGPCLMKVVVVLSEVMKFTTVWVLQNFRDWIQPLIAEILYTVYIYTQVYIHTGIH